MRLWSRLERLVADRPRCDRRVRWLAPEGYVPSDADRCPRCGGCHVLVIVEEVVAAPSESEEVHR